MANLTLRVPDELVARLKAEADRTKRSTNGMAEALFEEALSGLPEVVPARKSGYVKYGGWTMWWELADPKYIKVTAPAPEPEQAGWWVNPFAGTPGNGRQGSEGLWLTLRASDPADKNAWNRCVHALGSAGQPAPPYVQLCTCTVARSPACRLAIRRAERKSRQMPAAALNPSGGTAVLVQARVPDADVTRLAALATRKGIRQPAVVRRALKLGLDELEREGDTGLPDGG